jgi:hypothetical protein
MNFVESSLFKALMYLVSHLMNRHCILHALDNEDEAFVYYVTRKILDENGHFNALLQTEMWKEIMQWGVQFQTEFSNSLGMDKTLNN